MFSKGEILKNRKIKIFSDNKNSKTILKARSMKRDLQIITLDIYDVCSTYGITVVSEWLPRQQNERADCLFRSFDCDDWEINDNVFNILDSILDPHTIDRFSSNYNNKCFKFNSRWWHPEAEAVKAFEQRWNDECN